MPQSAQELPENIDEESILLCNAMNCFPGIQTIESCCGHGKDCFRIWFVIEDLDDLPPLLYFFDGCHTGVYGWNIKVNTDCSMNPVTFFVESSTTGEESYEESITIAKEMHKFLASHEEI